MGGGATFYDVLVEVGRPRDACVAASSSPPRSWRCCSSCACATGRLLPLLALFACLAVAHAQADWYAARPWHLAAGVAASPCSSSSLPAPTRAADAPLRRSGCSTPRPKATPTSSTRPASSPPTRSCSSRGPPPAHGDERPRAGPGRASRRRVDRVLSWSAVAKRIEAEGSRATAAAVDRAASCAISACGASWCPAASPSASRWSWTSAGSGSSRAGPLLARARDQDAGRGARHRGGAARRRGGPRGGDRRAPRLPDRPRRLAAPRRPPLHRRGPARGRQHADHGRGLRARPTPSARPETRPWTRTRRGTARSAPTRRSSWTSSRARRGPATSATSRARSCGAGRARASTRSTPSSTRACGSATRGSGTAPTARRSTGDPGALRARTATGPGSVRRPDAGLLPRHRPRPRPARSTRRRRSRPRPSTLRAGHVVTVEPGLYYLGLGGVRIEDVALVTKTGSRNLTRVPKQLEI